jgi:hypothetical protein
LLPVINTLTPAPLLIVGEGIRERGPSSSERIRGEGASFSEREKGRGGFFNAERGVKHFRSRDVSEPEH